MSEKRDFPSARDYDEGATHWHLDKRINVSHIVATLALAISAFAWGNSMDKRVTVLEAQTVQAAKDNDRQDAALKEATNLMRADMKEIKDALRELNNKIDAKVSNR